MNGIALWIMGALAAPLDDSSLQDLLDEVAPRVEAQAQRPFVSVPRVSMADRDALYPELLRPGGIASVRDVERTPSLALRHLATELLERAIAVYVAPSERVYVVEEVLAKVQGTFGLDDAAARPLVQCVMAHELVHALQHQYALEAPGPGAARRGQRALREGHASLVAERVCAEVHGPATVRLLETVQNIELEASLVPDEDAALYAWGRRLARTLEAEGLLWPALRASPPAWDDIVAAVDPTLATAWRVPDPLLQAVTGLGLGGRTVHHTGAVSPTSILLPLLGGRYGVDAMPRALGGFTVEAADAKGELMVLAFLLEDRGAARDLVAKRRARVDRGTTREALAVYGTRTGAMTKRPRARRFRRAERASEVVDALLLSTRTTDGGPYREVWVATPRRLFVLLDSGHGPGRGELVRAIEPLRREMTARTGAELGLGELAAWVAEVRRIDRTVTYEPSWSYRLHQAARGLLAGDDDACADVFGPLLGPGVPDRAAHARAAFDCAAVRWDLELADRSLALVDEVDPLSAVRLAAHALDADRPRIASRILAKTAGDEDHTIALAALRVATAVKLGRWAEVERMVERTPMLPAGVRAWAGSAMVYAGRRGPGMRILGAACPELIGEDRSRCRAFFAR